MPVREIFPFCRVNVTKAILQHVPDAAIYRVSRLMRTIIAKGM